MVTVPATTHATTHALPPAPFFLLRGHPMDVQCLQFAPVCPPGGALSGTLVSGDAAGFVIVWSLETFRPLAIWKAHESALLSVTVIGKWVCTHGRDNKLHLWEIFEMSRMSKELPITTEELQERTSARQKPFLVSSLDVNALNFCQASIDNTRASTQDTSEEVLVAVPGLLGNEYADIYTLPTTKRLATRLLPQPPPKGKLGNIMSLDLKYPLLVAGYENGSVALFSIDLQSVDRSTQKQDGNWVCMQVWTEHRDAVLSVVIDADQRHIYSCGIDAGLIRYKYGEVSNMKITSTMDAPVVLRTKHSGQQCMRMRSDGKLLGTAGWDSHARIYTVSKLKQVAVFGRHKGAINAFAFQHKHTDMDGMVALGGKDSKISLWKLF